MNHKTIRHLTKVAVAIYAATLCSCASDPMYTLNIGKIHDVNYPPDKIVGNWTSMNVEEFTYNGVASEEKSYYDIKPNGRGHLRLVAANPSSGMSISAEAEFSWKYLGANRWVITLPPSSGYRVTSSNNMQLGPRDSASMTVRYLDGNLYEVAGSGDVSASGYAEVDPRKVWVPTDEEHVPAMVQRLRGGLQIPVESFER